MSRRQLLHAAHDRVRVDDVPVAHVAREAGEIELPRHARMGQQRSQLRPEHQAVAELGIVERFLAHAIPREEKNLASRVPQREGEHAVEMFDTGFAEVLPGMDDDLGIGLGREAMAAPQQGLAELDVVVDLAIEDGPHRAVLVGQRLAAALGGDDTKTPMAERHGPVDVVALVVGSAVT